VFPAATCALLRNLFTERDPKVRLDASAAIDINTSMCALLSCFSVITLLAAPSSQQSGALDCATVERDLPTIFQRWKVLNAERDALIAEARSLNATFARIDASMAHCWLDKTQLKIRNEPACVAGAKEYNEWALGADDHDRRVKEYVAKYDPLESQLESFKNDVRACGGTVLGKQCPDGTSGCLVMECCSHPSDANRTPVAAAVPKKPATIKTSSLSAGSGQQSTQATDQTGAAESCTPEWCGKQASKCLDTCNNTYKYNDPRINSCLKLCEDREEPCFQCCRDCRKQGKCASTYCWGG
jgi:hypothetical protein